MSESSEEKLLLPHHVQQDLCTTRLPYRQGRKLTAVKVYTINSESNHLLIFGIPSLKLRQEAKDHFMKFGKLIQFSISTAHPAEQFTENYHAVYEKIQSARLAKRMLDTKTFYGSCLHICYAPELESIEETRQKLLLRQTDVRNRLKNLQRQADLEKHSKENKHLKPAICNDPEKIYQGPNLPNSEVNKLTIQSTKKLNMGNINTICIGKQIRDVVLNKKRKNKAQIVIEKRFKPSPKPENTSVNTNINAMKQQDVDIEVVDCTSVETDTITNIDEALNYKKFGNEKVLQVPEKSVNRIKFNIPNIKL